MNSFELFVPGKPTGKGRPRFANGRTYTDANTVSAEQRVQAAWHAAGRPRIDGPLHLTIIIQVARPKTHYRVDGRTLTAAGQRTDRPVRKPDVDNAAKLVMDALNGCAYRDDVDVVDLSVARWWADPDIGEQIVVKGRAWNWVRTSLKAAA